MVMLPAAVDFAIAPTVEGHLRKARFVIPVVALGGLAIGSVCCFGSGVTRL